MATGVGAEVLGQGQVYSDRRVQGMRNWGIIGKLYSGYWNHQKLWQEEYWKELQ